MCDRGSLGDSPLRFDSESAPFWRAFGLFGEQLAREKVRFLPGPIGVVPDSAEHVYFVHLGVCAL